MAQDLNFNQVQQEIEKVKNILIAVPAKPSLDIAAAGLALRLSLDKVEKPAGFACANPLPSSFNKLKGSNNVVSEIGDRNLIISFDYQKDAIEKVSYNIKNNKFNLVVQPKEDQSPLDPNSVSYSYSSASAEVIFVVGALKLEDLGNIYQQKAFENKTIINLDYKQNNSKFGKINLIDTSAAACSQITAQFLQKLNLPVDPDISANIYYGIQANTANFQSPKVGPETFETAAWALKNGAKKTKEPTAVTQNKPKQQNQPVVQQQKTQNNNQQQSPNKQPPPDWFKPKIYKGGGQLV